MLILLCLRLLGLLSCHRGKKQNGFTYIKKFIFIWNVNFYLVGNTNIFVLFMPAILSNMEMDERLHKKDDKCD